MIEFDQWGSHSDMARRITPSQWKSKVRQAQQKTRQAIDKFNREVRAHNQKVNQEINKYNREVNAYNARVRADRQRLRNELARLSRRPATTRFATFRTSFNVVHTAYEQLEQAAIDGRFDARHNETLDFAEREAANGAGLMNAILGDSEVSSQTPANPSDSPLTPILHAISADFSDRWRGALFSLDPINPDAARHFCSSTREIIAGILNTKAPDATVAAAMPDCDRTPLGTPTRRAKIRYFLHQKGMYQDELEDFVEVDMNNVVELFEVFNKGTHGSAGKFNLFQLQAIRKRAEDGIMFLSRLVS